MWLLFQPFHSTFLPLILKEIKTFWEISVSTVGPRQSLLCLMEKSFLLCAWETER